MITQEMLNQINEWAKEYGLMAEMLGDHKRVCVRGDGRAYLPVLVLLGSFPGHEKLAALSSKITNNFEIGSVTYELPSK